MAVMLDTDRQLCSADFQRTETGTFGAVLKADIKAAVDAADAWVVANQASYNSALPLAARNALTAAQKARLLMWVIKKRFDVGA